MPIYEYKCSACAHELESLQKFSDSPLLTCPACGKDALTKLVSAAGFQLKGSGWYQTDFRGSGAKPAAKSESSKADSGKDTAAGDASKSADAKPADGKAAPATAAAAPSAPSSGTTPAAGA